MRIILLAFAIALSACAKRRAVDYGAGLPAKAESAYVPVYEGDIPGRMYMPVGEMALRNKSPGTIGNVLDWARGIGSDAVILRNDGRRYKALAVVFKRPDARTQQSAIEEPQELSNQQHRAISEE